MMTLEELAHTEPWTASWAARHGEGERHLRAWLAAGRPSVHRRRIDVQGDLEIAVAVEVVIGLLPEAVAWRLLDVQIRCGRDLCERIPSGCRGYVDVRRSPLYVGILEDDLAVVAHEIGHAFTFAPNPFFVGLDEEQSRSLQKGLIADAVEAGRGEEIVDARMLDELAADELATMWLGFQVDTTSGQRGALRRERMRRVLNAGAEPELET